MKLLLSAITFTSALALQQMTVSWQNDSDMAAGILFGITKQDHLTNINSCMKDSDIFAKEVQGSFDLISKFDEADMVAGFKQLGQAMNTSPTMIKYCDNMGKDTEDLAAWAEAFLHPKVLVATAKYNVAHHKIALGLDAAKAKAAFSSGNFFKFGNIVGEMLVIVTQDVPALDNTLRDYGAQDIYNLTSKDYNSIIAGLVFGCIKQNDATLIEACMVTLKNDAVEVYLAYQQMRMNSLPAGLYAMIQAVKDAKASLSNCKNMGADVAKLQTWITTVLMADNIKTLIAQGVNDNKLRLTRDLVKARSYWNQEQYFQFGEIMGEMLVIATTPK